MLKMIYSKTHFAAKAITMEDLDDTMHKATMLVSNYIGFIAARDKKINYGLAIAGVICFLLAVIIGMSLQDTDSSPWFLPAFIIILYLAVVYGVGIYFRHRSSYELRMSQFLLAVFCRVENNRLYCRNGIEMRPGFLGKWIEFQSLDFGEYEDIIRFMRARFLKPSLEQKAAIFENEIQNNM